MNKYESIKHIARGSFGTVVQVQRKEDNKVFAIKRIPLENEKVISLAESEVKVLESLNHPCIVRYIEHYIVQENMASNLCIVLEYCSNGTLHQLIREQNGKHFSEEKILDWLAQLAWALETVHSRNIIHRDLKPQNILVDEHWTLKLADFGLCKVLQCDQSKATPTQTGTQQYMAPEVLNNKHYNASADIWSLGCVLYELMEFRPAFECNGNVIELMEMIKSGKYHAVRQTIYSNFLTQLIDKMINVNTESRPEASQLLLTEPLCNLKERIQNLESSNRIPQQDLVAVDQELSVEIINKCAIVHESSVRVIADDTPPTNHSTTAPCSNESTSTPNSRLTDAESTLLQFTYEGMSPVEANAAGFYQPFNSQEGNRLKTWKDIMKKKASETKIALLPPLLLNTEIIDNKVLIVVDAQRRNNEFWIWGAFHSKVSANVLPLNVQLDLSLTFTKADNTIWTVEKQMIATVEHKTEDWFFKNPLFILYDVPFSSFSSSSAPGATNISIRKIAPELVAEQKWFYCGLAPLFGQNDNSFTIDCNSLNGTYDCAQEWKKMVENENNISAQHACLSLPPMLLASGFVGDVAVCVIGRRIQNKLRFGAKFHSSMPAGVNSCEMRFKMTYQVKTQDKSDVTKYAEKRLTLTRKCTDVTTFINFPWSEVDSSILPRVTFSIIPL